jgi:N,N'-diacetyllegionaminate synthase
VKIEIIAEIGSNWEGSISKASKIIKECKIAGADAVKFQMWRADDLYKKDNPHYKDISKSELSFEKALKIKKICDKNEIEFFCSVFYPDAVKFLEKIGIKRYKIASYTAKLGHKFSSETILEKARTKKPIIISMGMGGNKKKLTKIFSKNKDLVYCYCIADYPTKFETINWKKAVKYDGFSDHSLGIVAPIIYAVLKKKQKTKKIIIEKHVKLKYSKGPDAPTSITVEELKELISYIRIIEKKEN